MLKSRKIAFYIRLLYGGGAERVLVNLMHGLTEQGIGIDLVMNVAEGPYLSQLPSSVRIINLDAPRMLAGLPKLASYLRKEKPVALLSALHYSNEIALWSKALSFSKTRIIVSEHNTLSIHSKYRKTDRWAPTLARVFYPWADKVVAVSHGVAKDLTQTIGLQESKVKVVYNPIITPQLFDESKQPLEHPWFDKGEPPVILGVGRLEPQKNFSLLIHAFAKTLQNQKARLMILGGGREREKLDALVKELDLQEMVNITGFVDNPYPYIQKASAYVLSSNWEGFGNVIVEAMALGTPVVATDCPNGPAEVLAGGKYGALVPMADVEAMASAMVKILNGKTYPTDASWLAQFHVDTVAEQYLKVFDLSMESLVKSDNSLNSNPHNL